MAYFTRATLDFFRHLTRNNRRPWFEAHRAEYEEHVKLPMRAFVEEMDLRIAGFAPEIVGDPVRSVFRIHRDIRFSKDKSPYKTHAGCWFYHRDGRSQVGREAEGGGAGFYFQVAPKDTFVGGGLWMPPRPALNRIRAAIAADPARFGRAANSPTVRRRFGGLSQEEKLVRMPRGYDAGHPAADWPRLGSFTVGRRYTDAEATSPRLTALVARDFTAIAPLVRWLNGVLGLKEASRR